MPERSPPTRRGRAIRGVTGTAGSGKSFALTARAARLAAEGKTRARAVLQPDARQSAPSTRRRPMRRVRRQPGPRHLHQLPHVLCPGRRRRRAGGHRRRPNPPGDVAGQDRREGRATCSPRGFERRFDAVFVDEGQDFTVEWWNLLREQVVRPDGEMLLVADPTVDLYGKSSWDDPDTLEPPGSPSRGSR